VVYEVWEPVIFSSNFGVTLLDEHVTKPKSALNIICNNYI
jgi:hypothetical protein